MQITNIRIRKIDKEGMVKGIVSITLDDAFVINDIKIIESNKSLFLSMPSRKDQRDGSYRDIAHPINSETRLYIQNSVIKHYNTLIETEKEVAGSDEV